MANGDYDLTHKKILESGKKIFKEQGFEKANLRAICKSAGITTGAFYGHFKDKESLFAELVEPLIAEIKTYYAIYEKKSFDAYEKEKKIGKETIQKILDSKAQGAIDTVLYFFENKDVFELLVFGSYGTKYSNFLDELIEIEKTSLKEKVEKYKKEFSEKLKDNPEIIKKLEEKLNEFLEKEVNNKDNSNDMAIFMKSKKLENIVNNFEEEYKNSAKKEIEKLENYLNEVAEDKTDIDKLRKSIKSTYNNYKDEIAKSDIKNISVTIAKAIKDKEDYHAEINGKAKKKERVKLRKISINSKSNIESEDEVNEYISAIEKDIEKLKNEMLEAIKNNKIVDIG